MARPFPRSRAPLTALLRGALLLAALTAPAVPVAAMQPASGPPAPSQPTRSPTYGRVPPSPRGIAIDTRVAEDLGLRVGTAVEVAATPGTPGEPAVVTAIVERRADPAEVARSEYRIRLHLDHLQTLLGDEDRVDRFAVGVRGAEGPARDAATDSATARINHLAFGFRAHRSRDVAVGSSRTFRVVERFHRAIGIITVVASAVFLLCLLLLTVEERRRDIAALRLMGVSRATVVRAIVMEAAVVSLVGCGVGAIVGWVSSLLVNAHYQRVYRTPLAFALLTPEILAFATGLSLLLGVTAGAAAAWRLVRVPPLSLLGR